MVFLTLARGAHYLVGMIARYLTASLFALALTGCRSARSEAHLISLSSLEQSVENVSRIAIVGDGFPHGARGEVLLEGKVYPPGEAPRGVALRAPCSVSDEHHAAMILSDAVLAEAPDGVFEGSVEVRFGERDAQQLSGRLTHGVLRFARDDLPQQRELAVSQRARREQRELGIEQLEQNERGAMVMAVAPRGPAALAGLARGDIIQAIDGAPVQMPVDVMPHAQRGDIELYVARDGAAGGSTIRIERDPESPGLGYVFGLLLCALGLGVGRGAAILAAPSAERAALWKTLLVCAALVSTMGVSIAAVPDARMRSACRALFLSAALSGAVFAFQRRLVRAEQTRDPALLPFL